MCVIMTKILLIILLFNNIIIINISNIKYV